ncbi:hypothetical protein HNQ80_001269 [Anaerosolibacter carboniphilus]|uniref:DUF3786 domain-containing protein n=1 Tax=Anaerosolibacter carboniphilus TaxID=1417629 RepID=A0A841KT23_9FIRM|nr:DUF3786 domain-containing protein [Anaerosolibacter carboniphilus]MBB6215180.1 hypothetical protein [Anaerosolibacter carboniphilus]
MDEKKSNYQLCYEGLCKAFAKYNPGEMAQKSGAEYDAEKGLFRLWVLDKEYLISYPSGDITLRDREKENVSHQDESVLEKMLILRDTDEMLFEKMLILSYLHRATKSLPAYRWVSYRELKGAGVYYDAFARYGIKPLAEFFGEKGDLFLKAGYELGAERVTMGDIGLKFNVLPNIPIVLVLWLGDEEFKASASILFDYGATEEIHVEDLASLGPWLVRQVIKAAKR